MHGATAKGRMKNCYVCGQTIPKGHAMENAPEMFPQGRQIDPPGERQVREQNVKTLPEFQPDLIKENPS
jgi:hypothetical protein